MSSRLLLLVQGIDGMSDTLAEEAAAYREEQQRKQVEKTD